MPVRDRLGPDVRVEVELYAQLAARIDSALRMWWVVLVSGAMPSPDITTIFMLRILLGACG